MANFIQKVKNSLFGDEKEFQSDKDAHCLVKSQTNGQFLINKKGMDTIHKHFRRVVSLIGRAGVGKSTLASSIYNVMREDKREYFEISDSEESFTKGIWSLNENQKMLGGKNSKEDLFDVLDLEGMENSDSTHYLVVVAMALSNVIVLCQDAESGRGRFNFDGLKTIVAGIRIYREYKINLPPPIIYLQVKTGKNKFNINKQLQGLNREKFISYIKETKFPELKDFDVRLFSIVDFDGDRFDSEYVESVREFTNDLTPEGKSQEMKESDENKMEEIFQFSRVAVEDRVKYVEKMVEAFNKQSPEMVVELNLKWYKERVKQIANECQLETTISVKQLAKNTDIKTNVSLEGFCNLFCPMKNGRMYYGEDVKNRAKLLSFYDANDARFNKFLSEYITDLSIDATLHCKLIYVALINEFERKQKKKGKELKTKNEPMFVAAIKKEVSEGIIKIKFKGDTRLPRDIKKRIQKKRSEFRNEIIKKTQNIMKLDEDDFSMDSLTNTWNMEVDLLKARWDRKIAEALGANKQKVGTVGDQTCPKCRRKGGDGVSCLSCDEHSIVYWVDNETKSSICDTCKDLRPMDYIVCRSCRTRLNVRIAPMRI